jgi:hypothetical protein
MRLWQPMLTFGLREDFILGKYGLHYKSRLEREQFFGLLRATSISVRWNKLSSRLLIDGIKLPTFRSSFDVNLPFSPPLTSHFLPRPLTWRPS